MLNSVGPVLEVTDREQVQWFYVVGTWATRTLLLTRNGEPNDFGVITSDSLSLTLK